MELSPFFNFLKFWKISVFWDYLENPLRYVSVPKDKKFLLMTGKLLIQFFLTPDYNNGEVRVSHTELWCENVNMLVVSPLLVTFDLLVQSLWKFAPVCFSGFYSELWYSNVKMLVVSPLLVTFNLPVKSLWKFAPASFSGFYNELWSENVNMLVVSPLLVTFNLPVKSLWKFAPVCFSGFYRQL